MKLIAVIDYGMCNLDSVARALEKCGAEPIVTGVASVVEDADAIVLPGVGAFCDAMKELEARSLISILRRRVLEQEIPFLGICLGMQLMADWGYEGGKNEGLGLISGEVVRFKPNYPEIRIPHIGWNEVQQSVNSLIFKNIPDAADFYFVHSYHFQCSDEYVIGRTRYCGEFISAIQNNNCFGVQFHPEKSQKSGLQLLINFCSC